MVHTRDAWYLLLMSIIICIDRLSKYWAYQCGIDVVLNRGISWGIGNSAALAPFVGITIALLLIIAVLMWYAYQRRLNYLIVGECMVIAGAISNVIDRFVYGGVVDFIAVHCAGWEFPVFNIADAAIVIGVLIMLWMQRDA